MYPRKLKPLIVFGRQRAGTRFLANVLNSFKEVAVQGELPNEVMASAVRMISEIEGYYSEMARSDAARRRREYDGWLAKKEDLIFSIWENAGQSARVRLTKDTTYFGYKRPNNESYFSFYEESFKFRVPMYVYCTRNFPDNYLSIVSRWPERGIQDVSSDYMASTLQYQRIKQAAPDRVLLFNLDDYVRHGLPYVEENIFRPLGLRLEEAHKRQLERMEATNRTEEDLKVPRRKVLNRIEQEFVDAHPELESEYRKLCWPHTRSTS